MNSKLLPTLFSYATVVILVVLDFHRPNRPSDIRYSVLQERYYFALFLYVIFAFIIYFLIATLLGQLGLAFEASVTGAILIIAIAPYLPIIGRVVTAIRRGMWLIARYPQSVETVSALLALSPLPVDPQARPELIKHLKLDGVPSALIDAALGEDMTVLSSAAARSLQEVTSLRLGFERLRKDRWYAKFCSVRADILDTLETSYLQLIRRTARVILFCGDVRPSDHKSADVMLEASEFIAEEAATLRSDYERLIAGVALSFAPSPRARGRLISSFGYRLRLPGGLPFAPIAVVFVLDFLISFSPVLVQPLLPREWQSSSIGDTVVFSLAHAVAISGAILWGFYPKIVSNFARPSLLSLPWVSYVVFGAASYLSGTAVMYIAVRSMHLKEKLLAADYPLLASFLLSLPFLLTTVAISMLLDLRLRNESYDYRRARVRDGLVLAAVMGGVIVFIAGMLHVLSPELVHAEFPVPWGPLTGFIVLYACLGFAMGFIPSTVEAHIEATKLFLDAATLDQDAKAEPQAT